MALVGNAKLATLLEDAKSLAVLEDTKALFGEGFGYTTESPTRSELAEMVCSLHGFTSQELAYEYDGLPLGIAMTGVSVEEGTVYIGTSSCEEDEAFYVEVCFLLFVPEDGEVGRKGFVSVDAKICRDQVPFVLSEPTLDGARKSLCRTFGLTYVPVGRPCSEKLPEGDALCFTTSFEGCAMSFLCAREISGRMHAVCREMLLSPWAEYRKAAKARGDYREAIQYYRERMTVVDGSRRFSTIQGVVQPLYGEHFVLDAMAESLGLGKVLYIAEWFPHSDGTDTIVFETDQHTVMFTQKVEAVGAGCKGECYDMAFGPRGL